MGEEWRRDSHIPKNGVKSKVEISWQE